MKNLALDLSRGIETVTDPSSLTVTSGVSRTEFDSSIAGVAAALIRNDEAFSLNHPGLSETIVIAGPAPVIVNEAIPAFSGVTAMPAQKPVPVNRTRQVEPPAVNV